jgi:hypothetical protein
LSFSKGKALALSLDFAGERVFVFAGTAGINFRVAETSAKRRAKISVTSRSRIMSTALAPHGRCDARPA